MAAVRHEGDTDSKAGDGGRGAGAQGPYQVVARRFRPKRFEELVGQEAVVRSLGGALQSGRVPHAFLFAGSRGVGKTTSARILARALNCERGVGTQPCGVCATCLSILAGTNPDIVEIDAASHNLVDDVRELCDRVGVASMGSRYKVYILDEVHMLTRNAFNAFLKTLEEPPRNVVFVLATTELHKVPETVRSRCQVVLFRRIDEHDVVARLRELCGKEGVEVADAVLEEIALACRGGMRDAESALERLLPLARASTGPFDVAQWRSLTQRVGLDRAVDVVEALVAGNAAAALRFADEAVGSGVDEREALGELLDVLRAALLTRIDGAETTLVAMSGALRERVVALAAKLEPSRLDAMLQAGLLGRERIRRTDDRRLVLELALVRMAEAGRLATLGELVVALESGVALPTVSPAGAAAAAPQRSAVPTAAPTGAVAVPGLAHAAPTTASLHARFVAKVRTEKPMIASTAQECDLDGPDERGCVRIALRSDRRLHVDRLASPEVIALFRTVLAQLTGREIVVEVVPGAGGGANQDGPAAQMPPTTAATPPGERVTRVRERFDGVIEPPAGS